MEKRMRCGFLQKFLTSTKPSKKLDLKSSSAYGCVSYLVYLVKLIALLILFYPLITRQERRR